MRIPYEDSPKVAPRALPETQQRVGADTGVGDLAAGLARAGQGAGSVGELVMGEYKKARDEADHTAVNNQLARLQDEHTSTLDGNAQQAAQQHLQSVQNLGGGGKTLEQQAGPSAAAAMSGADVPGRTVTVGLPGGFNQGPTDTSAKDAPRGFLYTRGEEAVAGSGVAITHLQAVQAQLRKELTNDRQRTLFDAQARGIYESGRRQVERHVSQQVQVAKEASLEARKASALTAIANNYGDDAGTADQMKSVEASIRSLAVSKEDGDHRVAEWETAAVSTRLNQFIAYQDWKGAENLFAAGKDKLGVHAAQYEKQITTLRDGVVAESTAGRIVSEATDRETGWVNPSDALKKLDELPAGMIKDETRQRVEHRLAVAHQQKEQTIDKVFDRALSAYQKGGTLGAVAAADKTFLQDARNDPKQWERLRAIARADADHARGVPRTPEQEAALTSFRVWAADNPDQAAQMTPEAFNRMWGPQLDRRDRETAGAVLAGYHAKENGTQKISPIEDKLLLQVGRDAGVFPGQSNDVAKWDDASARVYYKAIATLTDKTAQYRRSNGKPPPVEEVQKWASELFLQGTVPGTGLLGGGYFEDKTTRIEAEMGGTPFAPKWSERDIAEATKQLTQGGLEATDQNVDRYLRKKNSLPALPPQRTEPKPPKGTVGLEAQQPMKPLEFR
jgi:hypothetical protein